MKRILLVLALLSIVWLAFPQTGFLGLYYGESFSEAHNDLVNKGFTLVQNQSIFKQYGISPIKDVYQVNIYVNPDNNCIISWSLRFLETLSDEEQIRVLKEFGECHGSNWFYDEENKLYGWKFSDTKGLALMFENDEQLVFAMYYDETFAGTVKSGQEQNTDDN